MSDEKKRKFEERMAALHEKYCKQLPDKYREIEKSWNDYRSDFCNQEYREVFYRRIHTFKGTAATFGFVKQAESCFSIQKLLDTKENPSNLPDTSVALIEKALAELKGNINVPREDIPD